MDRATKHPPKLSEAAPASLAGGNHVCLSAILRESDPNVVRRSLESARPFLSAYAIVDTGSSDSVKATIRDVLRDIPGTLVEREWPNSFAIARNWSLALAMESAAEYACILDGDDFFAPTTANLVGDRLVLPSLPRLTHDAYCVQGMGLIERDLFPRFAFVRLAASIRWVGRVHEDLPLTEPPPCLAWYKMICTSGGAGSRDMVAKHAEYRRLLELELRDDPTNQRARQYLADLDARGAR